MVLQAHGTQMHVAYSCIGVTKIILILYPHGKYAGHLRKKLSLDSTGCRGERLAQQRKGQSHSYATRKCGPALRTLKSPTYLHMILTMTRFPCPPWIQKERFWKVESESITEEWKTFLTNEPEIKGLRFTWRNEPFSALFYLRETS